MKRISDVRIIVLDESAARGMELNIFQNAIENAFTDGFKIARVDPLGGKMSSKKLVYILVKYQRPLHNPDPDIERRQSDYKLDPAMARDLHLVNQSVWDDLVKLFKNQGARFYAGDRVLVIEQAPDDPQINKDAFFRS